MYRKHIEKSDNSKKMQEDFKKMDFSIVTACAVVLTVLCYAAFLEAVPFAGVLAGVCGAISLVTATLGVVNNIIEKKRRDNILMGEIRNLCEYGRAECLNLKDCVKNLGKEGEVHNLSKLKDEVNDIKWIKNRMVMNLKEIKNENYRKSLEGQMTLLTEKIGELDKEMRKTNVDSRSVIQKIDDVREMTDGVTRILSYEKDNQKYDIQMNSMDELEKKVERISHDKEKIKQQVPRKDASKEKNKKVDGPSL